MPSVELLCVGQSEPADFGGLTFAVASSPTRRSHRSPSLFQADFDAHPGVLYHLGNPNLKADSRGRCFFAYQLLARASLRDGEVLEFAAEHRPHLSAMLAELLRYSPAKRVLFTSDWQFVPGVERFPIEVTGGDFWHRHDDHGLRFNTLYTVVGDIR